MESAGAVDAGQPMDAANTAVQTDTGRTVSRYVEAAANAVLEPPEELMAENQADNEQPDRCLESHKATRRRKRLGFNLQLEGPDLLFKLGSVNFQLLQLILGAGEILPQRSHRYGADAFFRSPVADSQVGNLTALSQQLDLQFGEFLPQCVYGLVGHRPNNLLVKVLTRKADYKSFTPIGLCARQAGRIIRLRPSENAALEGRREHD